MMRAVALFACAAAAMLLASTAGRASDPAPTGRDQFRQTCGGCHLAGGFGTRVLARRVPQGQAELENRTGLNADYVKLVVRHGMGSMPQIRRTELPDAQLDAIARYLEHGQ